MFKFSTFPALCVGMVLFFGASNAQSTPQILNCLTPLAIFQETDSHTDQVWKDFTNNTEAPVEMSLAVQAEAIEKIDFVLMLDLDSDGTAETRVDSRHLPEAGMIPFNNEFSVADPVAFGPDLRKYTFALQIEKEATTTVARLVFAPEGSATYESMVLPAGHHSIIWSVTADNGEVASCFKMVEVQTGASTEVPAELSIEKEVQTDSFE